MKARIHVTPKPGVLDPQGQAVAQGLHALGHAGVREVRVGRFFDLELDQGSREQLVQMCEQLLANTVVEDFAIEILED